MHTMNQNITWGEDARGRMIALCDDVPLENLNDIVSLHQTVKATQTSKRLVLCDIFRHGRPRTSNEGIEALTCVHALISPA
jgi:hypothetical protein